MGPGATSFLQQRLSPVEAVVWSVRERQDGGVHQLPHPGVALLLAGAEAQVGNLRPIKERTKKDQSEKNICSLAATDVTSERTFRTIWTKSLGLSGLRPCSWRVQASKEDAWATISTLFPTRGRKPRQDATSAADKQ